MNEEKDAALLAEWLDKPGSDVPEGLDPAVRGAVYSLRPDLAPKARVGLEEVFAEVTTGPFGTMDPEGPPVVGGGSPRPRGGARVAAVGHEAASVPERPGRAGPVPWWRRPVVGAALAAGLAMALVLPLSMSTQQGLPELVTASPTSAPPATIPELEDPVTGTVAAPVGDSRAEPVGGDAPAKAPADVGISAGQPSALEPLAPVPPVTTVSEARPLAAEIVVAPSEKPAATASPKAEESPGADETSAPRGASAGALAAPPPPAGPRSADVGEADDAALGAAGAPPQAASRSSTTSSSKSSSTSRSEGKESAQKADRYGARASDEETLEDGSSVIAEATGTSNKQKKSAREAQAAAAPAAAPVMSAPTPTSTASAPPPAKASSSGAPADYSSSWYTRYADVTAVYTVAQEAERAGRVDEAVAAYQGLLGDSRSAVAQDAAWRAARLEAGRGDNNAALALVEQGLRRSSANTVYRSHLLELKADVLDRLGRTTEAAGVRAEAAALDATRR